MTASDETDMGNQVKLSTERRWWLSKWSGYGWSIADPIRMGVKKWKRHTEALVKAGLLEEDRGLYRITEAGRAALSLESDL